MCVCVCAGMYVCVCMCVHVCVCYKIDPTQPSSDFQCNLHISLSAITHTYVHACIRKVDSSRQEIRSFHKDTQHFLLWLQHTNSHQPVNSYWHIRTTPRFASRWDLITNVKPFIFKHTHTRLDLSYLLHKYVSKSGSEKPKHLLYYKGFNWNELYKH